MTYFGIKQYSFPNRAKLAPAADNGKSCKTYTELVLETDIEDLGNGAESYETDISDKYKIHQPHKRRDHGEPSKTQVQFAGNQVIDAPRLPDTHC